MLDDVAMTMIIFYDRSRVRSNIPIAILLDSTYTRRATDGIEDMAHNSNKLFRA